jgi:hypothetical protein
MAREPEGAKSAIDGVAWEVRPEWMAGRYWWRIYVGGLPKQLLRYRENAVIAAEAFAADEARFRRDGVMSG